ncbi:MAG: hypothetical protein EA380_04265 [Phycisphaeraceae bacterium]|nr:MAG: hypothetical protein EA380_04265 [Phycisphaeraceae bacterium]
MDWGIDWVLYDSRFRLLGGSDATFLQFLEEMLSPRVQATLENQRRAAVVINECLQEDGWQLVEQRSDSSRPHFKALRADLQSSSGIHELERDLVDQLQDLEASSPDNTILPRIQREIARILSGLRDGDAELVVGTAKELVESAAMWRLHALGNIETQGLDFQQRVSRAIQHMQYGEASVNQSASRIKSGLSQITTGLRDLRNHHGTGHGRHGGPSDIPADVLGLAVRCAIAVGIWLYTAPLPISEDA